MRTLRSLIVVALLLAIPTLVFAHTAADPYKVALLAGNPKTGIKVAGHAEIWDDGTELHVTYFLDFAPYVLDQSHIAVAGPVAYNGDIVPPTPEQIPQTKKLNPIPGQFPYGDGAGPFDIPISWGVGTELYVVIHGKICRDVESIKDAIDYFEETGEIFKLDVNHSSDPNVYIEAIIYDDHFLNGTYSAYCINPDDWISSDFQPYYVKVARNGMPHMDLVNYVINQDYIGHDCIVNGVNHGVYTNSDIQGAIWELFEIAATTPLVPPPDPDRVAAIVADALANGEGYEPGCGDYLAIKLIPDPPSQGPNDPVQKILIKFPIDCDCQTIWGGIVDGDDYMYEFPGDNWALYVTYTVQGASPAPPRMSLDSSVTTTWGSIKDR